LYKKSMAVFGITYTFSKAKKLSAKREKDSKD
jgi:hypothetical protein